MGPWLRGRFDGAAALVTGGAHGIGRACAVRLADEGARVAVMDIDEGATRGVVAHLAQIGGGPHLAMQMDVTDPSSVEQATRRSAGEFGQIDTLVNVAGGDTEHGTFEHSSDEVWTRMLELNLLLPLGHSLPAAQHHEPGHRDRHLDQRLHRTRQ